MFIPCPSDTQIPVDDSHKRVLWYNTPQPAPQHISVQLSFQSVHSINIRGGVCLTNQEK